MLGAAGVPGLTPDGASILETLRGAPELAAIATPALAAQLAELVTEARPVALVLGALADLQRKAAAAAAVGAAMGPRELAGKAVTFTLGARQRAGDGRSWGAARAKADRSPPLPPRQPTEAWAYLQQARLAAASLSAT